MPAKFDFTGTVVDVLPSRTPKGDDVVMVVVEDDGVPYTAKCAAEFYGARFAPKAMKLKKGDQVTLSCWVDAQASKNGGWFAKHKGMDVRVLSAAAAAATAPVAESEDNPFADDARDEPSF